MFKLLLDTKFVYELNTVNQTKTLGPLFGGDPKGTYHCRLSSHDDPAPHQRLDLVFGELQFVFWLNLGGDTVRGDRANRVYHDTMFYPVANIWGC